MFHPGRDIVSNEIYNQLFTLHGAVMIFLFIIPGIPAALGNFVLPLMLGAKDVAFPRLNLASYYLYVVGAHVLPASCSSAAGWIPAGPSTRLTAPQTTAGHPAMTWRPSSWASARSSPASTSSSPCTRMRAPGMTWFRMPLFLWGMYATAIIQVLATPVLAITLLLLVAERCFGIGIFDPKLGGDPVLFQHFFWFYSHPAVYIMIVPAMGDHQRAISVFSRKHIFGYRFIAYAAWPSPLLGFLVWGHHMFVSGQSRAGHRSFRR